MSAVPIAPTNLHEPTSGRLPCHCDLVLTDDAPEPAGPVLTSAQAESSAIRSELAHRGPLLSPALCERLGGPVIDGHAHLFPDRLLAAIWRAFRQDGYAIWHEGDSAAIADALLRTGAEKLFLLVYAHKPGVAAALNEWLHQTTQQQPRFIPFGSVHPDDADREAIVTRCLADYGFAGLKLHCSVQRMSCDDPRLDGVYDIVTTLGRAVVIHAGTAPYHDVYTGVSYARRLVARHPDLRIIFAHLGLWEVEAFGELAAESPNVYLDCSSVLGYPRFADSIDLAWLGEYLHRLADKILWGSDFPYLESSYAAPLEALCELNLPAATVAKLRHDTAQALLDRIRPSR